jgi:hypothetical protein
MVYAFKRVGRSRKLARKSRQNERLVWAIGASLFANAVGFFGIVYFDQSILAWYCVLAMVSASAALVSDSKKPPAELIPGAIKREAPVEDSAVPQYSARWA